VTVHKEGAAQVVLVGMPNSGKSSLVAQLTRATPEVAPYSFTTQLPMPGMMPYLNIHVQLVDMPPLTFEPARSWLPSLIRSADSLLLVVSLAEDPLEELKTTLGILGGWKVFPEGAEEEAADHGFGAVSMPMLVVANKIDAEGADERWKAVEKLYAGRFPVCAVSTATGMGLEDMKPVLFDLLHICRVYTKSPGHPPDLNDPVILPLGGTVEEFAGTIHKDLRRRMKFARIWGSAKYDGQKVTREFVLRDEDIVELHT
jgi:ribosome-interacting GTPase 1